MATVRRIAVIAGAVAALLAVAAFLWRQPEAPAPGPKPVAPSDEKAAPSVVPSGVPVAVQAARQVQDPRLRSRQLGVAVEEWLRRDVEGALAFARGLPMGNDRAQSLMLALSWIGRTDPDRALTLAREIGGNELLPLYSSLFAQLAARGPASAVGRLSVVPPGAARANALRATVEAWGRTNTDTALAWVSGLNDITDRITGLEALLVGLVPAESSRAVELARQMLNGAPLERVLDRAFQSLLASEPRNAVALVAVMPAGETRTLATASAVRALAQLDPGEAVAWCASLSPSEGIVAVRALVDVWAIKDPSAVAGYLATLSGQSAQLAGVEHLARVWGASAPANAIAWAQGLDAEQGKASALVEIASSWAQKEPSAAAAWASSLPEAGARDRALAGALSYWLLRDAHGAQSFVSGAPEGVQVSAAVAIAPELARLDPVGTMVWARALSSPQARESAIVAAYARWKARSPEPASQWLATSGLPTDLMAKLQTVAPR